MHDDTLTHVTHFPIETRTRARVGVRVCVIYREVRHVRQCVRDDAHSQSPEHETKRLPIRIARNRIVTATEASALLGVHLNSLKALIGRGEIEPPFRARIEGREVRAFWRAAIARAAALRENHRRDAEAWRGKLTLTETAAMVGCTPQTLRDNPGPGFPHPIRIADELAYARPALERWMRRSRPLGSWNRKAPAP